MKSIFKFICCGNVDDGKSTLIGRLLLNTNSVKKDQLEDALKVSQKNGSDKIELAMLLDGLLAEREQQITIDIAHRFFDYNDIRFHILDCPGHEQYTKNMAIAAASVNTAILVIDAVKGIKPQTLKHLEICNLFEIKNLLIALTKVDLLQDKEGKLDLSLLKPLENRVKEILSQYKFNYEIVPVSAVTDYNTDCVLKFLSRSAVDQMNEQAQNDKVIMHILASKLFKDQRYYYAKNMSTPPRQKNALKLIVYPQNTTITVKDVFETGTFTIEENVDITKGDCVANTDVLIADKIKHSSIFFDKKTDSMLFKHGTNIRRVIQLTPSTLQLDAPIIFNNIDDVKKNGFGIFIDETTKKTIGCAVFKNNKAEERIKTNTTNYVITGGTHIARSLKALELRTQFYPVMPLILDNNVIAKDVFNQENSENLLPLFTLADYINAQGISTICLIDTLSTKEKNNHPTYVYLDLEK